MALKLKFRTQFPALVTAASPLTLEKTGLEYDLGFDVAALLESLGPIFVPSSTFQVITAPGDVTVLPTDGLIILNKTVLAATNILLPPSLTKIGSIKIVNWKDDAGAYTHNVNLSGADKFNANQTTWPITGLGASVVFDPIPTGIGYAV
jgi:hypothetical protein